MQAMVPQYLEASMDAFRRNQSQFRQAMEGAFAGGPFAEIARRNMDMLEAAATAFQVKGGAAPTPAPAAAAAKDDDIAALKAQMANLQSKLDKLGD
jgi:polyhydroxyalkanoate synthesis regulator protein